MDLSQEDSLRLNVLLHQDIEAIRIDESKMIVYGLSPMGEAKVQLNPNCRDEQYIKQIKEVISAHVLGSPGGYPIYLRRWTRMGQARDESLDRLLKLGEPEAVVAVVHAQGLTDELARRAWWAMPSAVNARCMLDKQSVAEGRMGPELASFLLEFLPFEEEPRDIIESVRLVLKPGLIDAQARQALWARGSRKNVFLVGFLYTTPDDLPEQVPAHRLHAGYQERLQPLAEQGNVLARQLLRLMSPAGQAYVKTVTNILGKPSNQDVVVALLEAIERYFEPVRLAEPAAPDLEVLIEQAAGLCAGDDAAVRQLLQQLPEAEALLQAMLTLSLVGVHVVNPIFALTDSMGTVMRRKLAPVSKPMLAQLDILAGRK